MIDWLGSAKIDNSFVAEMTDAGVDIQRFHPVSACSRYASGHFEETVEAVPCAAKSVHTPIMPQAQRFELGRTNSAGSSPTVCKLRR